MTGISSDDKLWALLAHLSYFVLAVFGPLIIWLVKRDESEFVEDQAKEALNFQLAVLIVSLVCAVTVCLIPVTIVVAIGGIVYSILGGIKAYEGVAYRYPYTFRIIN
jgi:uncharacterized Tic20 family protein